MTDEKRQRLNWVINAIAIFEKEKVFEKWGVTIIELINERDMLEKEKAKSQDALVNLYANNPCLLRK